jgi:hypothetical protein
MSVYLYTLRKTGSKKFTAPNGEKLTIYPFKFVCGNAGSQVYNYKTQEFELPAHERRAISRAETSFENMGENLLVNQFGVVCLQLNKRTYWYDCNGYTGLPVAEIDENNRLIPLKDGFDPTDGHSRKLRYLKEDCPEQLAMWLAFNGLNADEILQSVV